MSPSRVRTIAAAGALCALAACESRRPIGDGALLPRPEGSALLAPADAAQPSAIRGTPREVLGQIAAPPRLTRVARALPVVPGDRQVSVDLRDTEAERVAREVLVDILGLAATIDPGLRGRISLRTGGQVPASDLPRLLDEALAPLGWGLAASAGRVRVGRLQDLEAAGGIGQAELRIVPLRYLRAEEILPAIQANLPAGARVSPDPAGRGVVVEGPGNAVAAVEDLLRIFDVDLLASRSFGVYPLSAATPAQVVRELEAIFGGQRGLRFIAVDRLNAVLAVADTPAGLRRVRQSIAQLDSAPQATAGVQIYPLRHRRAQEMAEILARLFGAPTGAAPFRPGAVGEMGGLRVGPAEGAGTVGARPPGQGASSMAPGAGAPGMGMPGQPAMPPGMPGGDFGAGQLTPAQLAAELGLSGPVRVQADPGRNALVVLASPADFRIVEQTIRRLDVRPRQIFIEAAIAEVTLNDGLRFGLEYAFRNGNFSAGQTGQGGGQGIFGQLTPQQFLTGLSGLNPTLGGFAAVFSNANIGVTLQALSAVTNVQVVSAPRLLVLDNELATLQVGDQVPVLARQSQSVDNPNAPIVSQVDFRDTGVILAVRARAGAGGAVSLDIFQEVSDAVRTATSLINSPTIRMRRVQSTVTVANGETVALGGLMRDRAERDNRGLPVLSQLPYVGSLFGTRGTATERTELLVMLTPRVVDDTGEATALADELRARLGALAPELARGLVPPPPLPRAPRGAR